MYRIAWSFILVLALFQQGLAAEHIKEYYQEPDLHKFKSDMGTKDFETIDPFTGLLRLNYIDVSIPGTNGLDINVHRVYNNPVAAPENRELSPVGYGWTMHQGRVIFHATDADLDVNGRVFEICDQISSEFSGDNTIQNNPVFEAADGTQHQFYRTAILETSGTRHEMYMSKTNWRFTCEGTDYVITNPAGTKYYATHAAKSLDQNIMYWYVTRVVDTYGNELNIDYTQLFQQGGGVPYFGIKRITSSDNREVVFNYRNINTRLASLESVDAVEPGGGFRRWNYSVTPMGKTLLDYNLLKEVQDPENNFWRYDYWELSRHDIDSTNGDYTLYNFAGTLRQVHLPILGGGYICYQYDFVNILPGYENIVVTNTNSVKRKTLANNPAACPLDNLNLSFVDPSSQWNYTYNRFAANSVDQTIVELPEFLGRIEYDYIGASYYPSLNDNLWSLGLQVEKRTYGPGDKLEEVIQTDWQKRLVSFEDYARVTSTSLAADTEIYAADIKEQRIIHPISNLDYQGGRYTTTYSEFDMFGNPFRVEESGKNSLGVTIDSRITTAVYGIYIDNWVLNVNENETVLNVNKGNSIVEDSVTNRFYRNEGSLVREESNGILTEYTYHPDGNLWHTKDMNNNYSYLEDYKLGIPQLERYYPRLNSSINISRVVSDRGTIQESTNGRGKTTTYSYDDINRLKDITLPKIGTAHVSAQWNTSVYVASLNRSITGNIITRGNYQNIQEIDRFGRTITNIHHDLSGLDTDIIVTYQYDILDRKTFESHPNSSLGTSYEYDILNRVKKVTHADGSTVIKTYYPENKIDIEDENGKITTKYFRAYGNPANSVVTRIESPEDIITTIDSNELDQPLRIWQGNSLGSGAERTYTYNSKNQLETVTNPENGVTSYTYDLVGNLKRESVNGILLKDHLYDGMNRLIVQYANGDSIEFGYYGDNSLKSTRIGGRSTKNIIYDDNGNLDNFTAYINGYNYTVTHEYNELDNLKTLTYPSGTQVDYTPDVFGRPRSVLPFVNSVYYYPSGQTEQIAYANGIVTDFTLDDRLRVETIKTGVLNQSPISDLTYSYDFANNVKTITNALDPQYNRSMTYDGVNRLDTANGIWGTGSFGYDSIGNLRSKTVNGTTTLIDVDSTGVRPVGTYDYLGNKEDLGLFSAYYNDLNQLESASGPIDHPSPKMDFTYNAEGMRIQKRTRDNSNQILTTTNYVYDGNNLLAAYFEDPQYGTEYYYLGSKQIASQYEPGKTIGYINTDVYTQEGDSVQLDASYLRDPDGQIVSYEWVQVGGPAVLLYGANTALANFVTPNYTQETVLTFELTVTDNDGNIVVYTITVTVADLVKVPDQIDDLFALQGDQENIITWKAQSETTYDLYWSTSPDVTSSAGTLIPGVSPPFTHTGLINGTDYYYVVTATDNHGTSLDSNVVSARPGANGWSLPSDESMNRLITPEIVGARYYQLSHFYSFTTSNDEFVVIVAAEFIYDAYGNELPSQVYALGYSPASGWKLQESFGTVEGTSNMLHQLGVITAPSYEVVVSDDRSHAVFFYRNYLDNNTVYAKLFRSGGWDDDVPVTNQDWISAHFNRLNDLVIVTNDKNGIVTPVYYDAALNTWATLAASEQPVEIWGLKTFTDNGKLIIVRTYAPVVSVFDVNSQNWIIKTEIDDYVRSYPDDIKADSLGNNYIIYSRRPKVTDNEEIRVAYNLAGTDTWVNSTFVAGVAESKINWVRSTIDESSNDLIVFWSIVDYSDEIVGAKIRSRRFSVQDGWSPIESVTSPSGGIVQDIHPAVVHNDGSVSLFWVQGGPIYGSIATIYSRTYDIVTGWKEKDVIGTTKYTGSTHEGIYNTNSVYYRPSASFSHGDRTNFIVNKSANGNMFVQFQSLSNPKGQLRVYVKGDGWKELYANAGLHDVYNNVYYKLGARNIGGFGIYSASISDSGHALVSMSANGYMHYSYQNASAGDVKTQVYPYIKVVNNEAHTSEPIQLDASQSYSLSGDIVQYEWSVMPNGPGQDVGFATVNISDPTSATPTVSYVSGTGYGVQLHLKVTDVNGNVGETVQSIRFLTDAYLRPIAHMNAGPDLVVNEGDSVTIDASASYWEPAQVYTLIYSWNQLIGPKVNLDTYPSYNHYDNGIYHVDNATSSSPTVSFTAPQVDGDKTLVFSLVGSTGAPVNLYSYDEVVVTVRDTSGPNTNPVANAGLDQTVTELTTVNLDASASNDPDGTIAGYQWTQTAGPIVTLTNANTATPSFTAPDVVANTNLNFSVVVTDDQGATGNDAVLITVQDATSPDTTPPVVTPPANITTEATATLTAVTLGTASANDDTDGALTPSPDQTGPFPLGATTVTWSATDTGGNTGTAMQTVTITDTTPPVLTVPANITVTSDVPLAVDIGTATATDIFTPVNIVNDAPALFPVGITTVTWSATDANGVSATDTQTVTVDASPNQLPVANAGVDQTVAELTTVNLTALASNDPDGTIVGYQWTQTAGPIVTLNNANTATPNFTAPDVLTDTILTFSVVVTDDRGDTANDSVLITVQNVATAADLAMSAFSSSTNTLELDVSFSVSWTVLNQGTGTVGSSYAGVYISTDPTFSADDISLTQRWVPSLASGASNSNGASPTIATASGLSPGSYYLLAVADKFDSIAEGNESNNIMAIAVTIAGDAPPNQLPVANAGLDQTVVELTTVNLTAAASNDPDGTITAYQWSQTSGPAVSLLNANTATPSFVVPDVTTNTVLSFNLVVTDDQAATGTDSVNITVQDSAVVDTTPPIVTPPTNITTEATAGLTDVNLGTASANDDTDGPLIPTANQIGPFPLGITTVTWSATDAAGNTGTATQTVTITDTTPPVLTVPADITVTSDVPLSIDIGNATATDIFTPITIVNDAPALFPVGITTVTWTATDANGVSSTGTQTVTVNSSSGQLPVDVTMSAFSSSTNTLELDVPFSVSWTVLNQGTDAVGASYAGVYISTDPNFSADDISLTQRWTPSLASGASNSRTASPTIGTALGFSPGSYYLIAVADKNDNIAEDNENNNTRAIAITIAGEPPANQSPVANAGVDQTVVELTAVTLNASASNDPDGTITGYQWTQAAGPSVTLNNANTATPNFVTPDVLTDTVLTFSVVVTDDQAATASDTVLITVQDAAPADITPPVVTPPANITTEATAVLTTIALGSASANDDTDGALTPTPDQTGPFGIGTTIVTWSAIDAAGNTGTATQTVSITDTTPPVLTVPANITVSSDVPLSIDIGNATATDIFTPVNISNDAPALFPVGVTTVTWTATDANGVSATATQTITVDSSPNQLPIANAGPDQTVAEFNTVNLNATASNDPDGSIVGYQWTQTAGPIVTLNNANTATPNFVAPDVLTDTVLTFSVVVTDDRGDTANDGVLITVQNVAAAVDLTISANSSTTTMVMDVSFSVNWTVLNSGTGTVGSSYTGVYISADPIFSGDDVSLTQRWTPSLASGASDSRTVSPTVGTSLGLSPGSYYLLVVADKNDNVAEDNENNNTVAIAITVTVP